MIYQRLAALFARYCAEHIFAPARPRALYGEDGQTLGHIDRIALRGARLFIDGWADCDQIILSQAGRRNDLRPSLPRRDVALAFPDLATISPGFSTNFSRGEGTLTLTLVRGSQHMVYAMPMPNQWAMRAAKARLILPFLRDLGYAMPSVLRWFVTKNPACRTMVKQHLGLTTSCPSPAMQSLLFLADSLAKTPEKHQAAARARLHPAALGHRSITIILPIFNALDLLPEVLDRVVRHTDLPWRLILIDDASPDPALRPFLRAWVAAQKPDFPDRIILIENNENQGFIRSVNAGLTLALGYGDHVVLLNSDAFVPQAWATRLLRPFLAHDRVASVTPMSNDAEIFSVPRLCQRTVLAPGDGDAIDTLAAKIHPDAGLADAPTGVGFCMAMSIDYLRRIPQLDTAFGRGYGEEVDWCQKARVLGGRHLGLANLFVEHRGGTSFGSVEKQRLVARNGATISRRYPAYDADVQRFIAEDPLAASRLALAIAWAAARAKTAIPLYLAHNLGGGAEDYLAQRITRDLPASALVLRVGTALRWQLELHSDHGITRGGTDDFALIQRLLDPVKSLHIIYSCGVGDRHMAELPGHLLSLCRSAADQIEMLIHDFLPISPSYTLLNSAGRYLGLPDPATADAAHCAHCPDGASLGLTEWQAAWAKLLAKADDITVFSDSSARILTAAYPFARRKMRLHPHTMLEELPPFRPAAQNGPRVIGVLGNIGLHKGAAVLQTLSQRLARNGAASLVVLGRVDPIFPLCAPALVHGGYLRRDIPALIARYGITDWLMPSIWPETFSYTTHEAIATGLPVWGFDLGAQADAIRNHGKGGVLPIPDGVPDLEAFIAALLPPQTESAAA